eukprot:13926177-Alexandrium_andersonii.AAC.1
MSPTLFRLPTWRTDGPWRRVHRRSEFRSQSGVPFRVCCRARAVLSRSAQNSTLRRMGSVQFCTPLGWGH